MDATSWAVLAALALVCAANWWSRLRHLATLELVTKPLATVLAAVLCAVHGGGGAVTAVAVVGFVPCLAGDVFLLDRVDRFVAGLASFLLGHIAFIVACVLAGSDRVAWAVAAAACVAVVMATVGRAVVAGARRSEPALVGPVLAYLVVIGSMAVFAAATGRVAAVVGAACFVVSDSILGWGKFVGERRWTGVAIMVTYHLALGGLALGL